MAGGAIAVGVTSLAVIVSGWLAFQHKPSWYQPPQVTAADVPRIRKSIPERYQSFTDALMAGGTFDYRLTAQTLNEWIAARAELWPDAAGAFGRGIEEPVVAFEGDRVIVSATYHRGNWRTVVSAHHSVRVDEGQLVLQLVKLAVGSLTVPMGPAVKALDARIQPLLAEGGRWCKSLKRLSIAGTRFDSVGDLVDGWGVKNNFHWSNGDRRFRIVAVQAKDGVLNLRVEGL